MRMNSLKEQGILPDDRFTRFAVSIIKPYYLRKVIGKENIDTSRPAVFTCNHGKTVGPVTSVLSMPVRFRPWINACMLNREEATDTIMRTFRNKFKFLGSKVKRRLIWWISKPMCYVLNSFRPIPVYKGMPKESVGTIEQSVEALRNGDNILIFQEKPGDHYSTESYKVFNTGFAALGKAYYDKTGQCLDFYPMWSDPKGIRFIIGRPVRYDPSGDDHAEKLRISAELKKRMLELKDTTMR